MEMSLHRELKQNYAGSVDDTEVLIGGYRIDAVRGNELIEIQCASLAAIRNKATDLVRRHRLRIVKPIVARTRILKSLTADGPVTSRRLSPKKCDYVDVFEELIYLTGLFPHRNLVIEVPLITVSQRRIPVQPKRQRRRRWKKDHQVADTTLEAVLGTIELRTTRDLLKLANWTDDASTIDTAQLALRIDRPRWIAQKVAYVLRQTGAVVADHRNQRGIQYRAA